jgi:short-subunit dehydrogenase
MAARGSGAILNVSSTASFQPNPYFAVYGATKAFVTSFSMALAYELRPRGVRVLAHCPGPTRTEFNDVADMRAGAGDWLYMTAERCVAIGLRALERRRWLVVTGFLNWIASIFSRRSPMRLATLITARFMRPVRPPKALPTGR